MVHLVRLLCLLLAGVALSGCAEQRYSVPMLKLRYATAIERRVTLSTMRRAWEDRPRKICSEGNLYERGLLNRAAFFGRKIKNTETYEAACNFWMDCLLEHIERYEAEAPKFMK